MWSTRLCLFIIEDFGFVCRVCSVLWVSNNKKSLSCVSCSCLSKLVLNSQLCVSCWGGSYFSSICIASFCWARPVSKRANNDFSRLQLSPLTPLHQALCARTSLTAKHRCLRWIPSIRASCLHTCLYVLSSKLDWCRWGRSLGALPANVDVADSLAKWLRTSCLLGLLGW